MCEDRTLFSWMRAARTPRKIKALAHSSTTSNVCEIMMAWAGQHLNIVANWQWHKFQKQPPSQAEKSEIGFWNLRCKGGVTAQRVHSAATAGKNGGFLLLLLIFLSLCTILEHHNVAQPEPTGFFNLRSQHCLTTRGRMGPALAPLGGNDH